MDLGAALVGLLIALVVKLAVMILGFRLLLKVYRSTYGAPPKRLWLLLPGENLPEIRVLWWSLFFFCISELTCGIEIYILFRSSPILTGIHGFTSGFGMALFALGCYLYLNKVLIRFSQPACIVNRICRGCTIREAPGCKFNLTILFISTFVALAAVLPFFAPTEALLADTSKYILPFESLNRWFDETLFPWLRDIYPEYDPSGAAYTLPESMSVIEFKILPALALLFAIAAIVLARTRRETAGLKVMVLAIGLLCYTYFELILYRATGDTLMGSLGHEVAELWFLLITAEFLRRAFHPDRNLGKDKSVATAERS